MPNIRNATADDLPELVRLLGQLNETAAPLSKQHRQAFVDVSADPRQRLLVVEDGGALIATAAMVVIPNVGHGGRPYAIVENVVVDEPARGRGIGEMLMRYIVEEARNAGCYKVALTSRKFRTDAHRFYERIGFEATSEGSSYTRAELRHASGCGAMVRSVTDRRYHAKMWLIWPAADGGPTIASSPALYT